MFLATTALREFWDPSQEMVFLGTWCFTGSQESDLSARHCVMPSPWNDRQRFYLAASYVDSCSEYLLGKLREYLNRVHGTNHSERYWRMILGPWLMLYSSVFYDRFIHLQTAFESYPKLDTIVMHDSSFRTPADMDEADEFVASDEYNLQIFSQLLRSMDFSFPSKRYQAPKALSPRNSSSRDRGLAFIEKVLRLPFEKRATVATGKTNLSPFENWKLAWATRFKTLPLDFSLARRLRRAPAVFDEVRLGLGNLSWTDSFQRMLSALLPSHFPTRYLEGYRSADQSAAKTRPTAVIVSGNGWSVDEMKFYGARAIENGSRLVAVQHGGGYGVYRSAPHEVHERRLTDCFLTWGWADDGLKNPGNIVNPRFCWLENQMRRRVAGNNLLFVATGQPRYLYRFHSCPAGSQWEEYFDWQFRFLTFLPDGLRSSVSYRPYPVDYSHAGELRVRRSFPSLKWDGSSGPIWSKLIVARIVIIDHLGTTFLESLAGNIPTILFWDPKRWEVRPEAQTYFERLREAQILYDSPETAAEKLIEVYAEPGRWWDSDRVQTVRREFVSRHALTEKDWISSWVQILRKIPSAGLNG